MKLHSPFLTIIGVLGHLGAITASGAFGAVACAQHSYVSAGLFFLVTGFLVLLLTRLAGLRDEDLSQGKVSDVQVWGGPWRAICVFKRNGRWRWANIWGKNIDQIRSWTEVHDVNRRH